MTDDIFDYVPQSAGGVAGATKTSNAIELPVPSLYAYWTRGDKKMPPDYGSGVKHFGGWSITQTLADEVQPDGLPPRWVLETFDKDDGSQYSAYTSRSIIVTPVGRRIRWVRSQDNQLDKNGKPKKRSHVQWLCCAANYDKDAGFNFWHVVVLTAKSVSTQNLDRAFDKWGAVTAKGRRDHAKNFPANMFWMALGTFGNEYKFEKAGTSYRTPIDLWEPKEYNRDFFASSFIGKEVDVMRLELLDLCKEWLEAWKNYNDDSGVDDDAGESPAYAPAPAQNKDYIPF